MDINKAQRRERKQRRKDKMIVDGKGVFLLQEAMIKRDKLIKERRRKREEERQTVDVHI